MMKSPCFFMFIFLSLVVQVRLLHRPKCTPDLCERAINSMRVPASCIREPACVRKLVKRAKQIISSEDDSVDINEKSISYGALRKQNTLLKKEMEFIRSSSNHTGDRAASNLKRRLERCKSKLSRKIPQKFKDYMNWEQCLSTAASLEEDKSRLSEDVYKLEQERKSLETEVVRSRRRIAALENQRDALKARLDQSQLVREQNQLNSLQAQLAAQQEDRDELKNAMTTAEDENSILKQNIGELNSFVDELKTNITKEMNEKNLLVKEKSKLVTKIKECNQTVRTANASELKKLMEENSDLVAEKFGMEAEVSKLELKYEALRASLLVLKRNKAEQHSKDVLIMKMREDLESCYNKMRSCNNQDSSKQDKELIKQLTKINNSLAKELETQQKLSENCSKNQTKEVLIKTNTETEALKTIPVNPEAVDETVEKVVDILNSLKTKAGENIQIRRDLEPSEN